MMISYYYSNMLVDKLFFIFVCCATLVMLINGQINSDLREASVPDDKTPEKFALELFGVNKIKLGSEDQSILPTIFTDYYKKVGRGKYSGSYHVSMVFTGTSNRRDKWRDIEAIEKYIG